MVNLVEKMLSVDVLEKIARMWRFLRLEPDMIHEQGSEVLSIFVGVLDGILANLDPILKRLCEDVQLDRWETLATVRRLSDIINSVDELHLQLQFIHGPWVRPETRVFIRSILDFIPRDRRPEIVSVVLSNTYSFEESDLSLYLQYRLSETNVLVARQTETPTVFLPKIERDNPLNWANLVHECGHADNQGIKELFRRQQVVPHNTDEATKEILRRWAEEIYCDVFATQVLGPAYLASFATFALARAGAGGAEVASETHPADIVRICIIRDILEKNCVKIPLAGEWQVYEDLASFFYNTLEQRTKLDRENGAYMKVWPQPQVMLQDFVDAICEEIDQLMSLSQQLTAKDFSRIRLLVEKRMARGIPIASYRGAVIHGVPVQSATSIQSQGIGSLKDNVSEQRTSLWEIVNAGWLHRIEYIYPEAFCWFFTRSTSPLRDRVDNWGRKLEATDKLLLKSIEASEIQRLMET